MSEYTPITGELREYAGNFYLFRYKDVREKLDAIADRIEAEHNLATANEWMRAIKYAHSDEGLAEYGLVRLPVDADGVSWHIGDVTESGQTVEAMGLNKHGWHFVGTINEIDPSIHRHHAPTVEDVLREFARECLTYATCVDDHEVQDAIEMYAAKLRLAGE